MTNAATAIPSSQSRLLHSSLIEKGTRRRAEGAPFFVVFTDIDNTLKRAAGDRDESSRTVCELAHYRNIPLIAVTGLTFERVMARIERGELPLFDGIAASLGTDIRLLVEAPLGERAYVRDEEYATGHEASWPDHAAVYSCVLAAFERVSKRIEHAQLREPDGAVFERFKISGHFFSREPEQDEILSTLTVELDAAGLGAVTKLVVCEEIEYNAANPDAVMCRYVVDIVPVTKADAVHRICSRVGVEAGIIAGDSGNDLDMLLRSPRQLTPVLVGGAQRGAAEFVRNRIVERHSREWVTVLDFEGHARSMYIGDTASELGPDSLLAALSALDP